MLVRDENHVAALASVASSIIMVLALDGGTADPTNAINTSIALAVPLSVAGLFLTMICRTLATGIVHIMDGAAEKGDFAAIERWQVIAILMQGVRIAIPAAILCFIPSETVTSALNAMPAWLSGGMAVGGGMVAAVGYAMVINMMATKEVWPFFILGFVLAAISELTLIALGLIGISLALIYLGLKDMAKQGGGNGGSGGSGNARYSSSTALNLATSNARTTSGQMMALEAMYENGNITKKQYSDLVYAVKNPGK